jgi:hypothetical protein
MFLWSERLFGGFLGWFEGWLDETIFYLFLQLFEPDLFAFEFHPQVQVIDFNVLGQFPDFIPCDFQLELEFLEFSIFLINEFLKPTPFVIDSQVIIFHFILKNLVPLHEFFLNLSIMSQLALQVVHLIITLGQLKLVLTGHLNHTFF